MPSHSFPHYIPPKTHHTTRTDTYTANWEPTSSHPTNTTHPPTPALQRLPPRADALLLALVAALQGQQAQGWKKESYPIVLANAACRGCMLVLLPAAAPCCLQAAAPLPAAQPLPHCSPRKTAPGTAQRC